MNSTIFDWRKQAAQITQGDTDIEKAFADTAFSQISAKAGRMMQPPHILGFEQVYANDDKTRLVGIFAFRSTDELFYAPVFFLAGQIKGDALLYRVAEKRFVPLTEDWVNYLLEKNSQRGGTAIDRSVVERMRMPIDITPLAFPRYTKRAEAWKALLDTWGPDIEKTAHFKKSGALKEFMIEDGGIPAFAMIKNAIDKSYEFADALASCLDMEDWAPAEMFAKHARIKSASAPKSHDELILHTGLTKSASAEMHTQLCKDGFALTDYRKPEELTTVYADWEQKIETVTESGEYEVPMMDGKKGKGLIVMARCLKGLPKPGEFHPDRDGEDEVTTQPYPGGLHDTRNAGKPMVLITTEPETTFQMVHAGKVLGTPTNDVSQLPDLGKETMTKGNAYAIYRRDRRLAAKDAYYVSEVEKNSNGTTAYVLLPIDHQSISGWSWIRVIYNPDAPATNFNCGILNKECKFIELPTERRKNRDGLCAPISDEFAHEDVKLKEPIQIIPEKMAVNDMVNREVRSIGIDEKEKRFMFNFGSKKNTPRMSKMAAAVFLARDLNIGADDAAAMLAEPGTYHLQSPATVKSAYAVSRIIDRANFRPDYDSEFHCLTEQPRDFALRTVTDAPMIRDVGVNEVQDPALGGAGNTDRTQQDDPKAPDGLDLQTLLTSDPSTFAGLAQAKNMPNVFEHGMIGALSKTFDAVAMVAKYLPKIEEAVDAFGRILFLFYWKPEDFQKAYGNDDQSEIESELDSNFKATGSQLLDLMKRSKNRREGTAALG